MGDLNRGPDCAAFTTQLATKEWRKQLGGDIVTDVILDCMVRNTIWVDAGKCSIRQRHGQTMLERPSRQTGGFHSARH